MRGFLSASIPSFGGADRKYLPWVEWMPPELMPCSERGEPGSPFSEIWIGHRRSSPSGFDAIRECERSLEARLTELHKAQPLSVERDEANLCDLAPDGCPTEGSGDLSVFDGDLELSGGLL